LGSLIAGAVLLYGCGGGRGGNGGEGQLFVLQSNSFRNNGSIPAQYSFRGGNTSPHLRWSNFPEQTRSFVITCIDIDAENFVHWVVYDIPVIAEEIDISEGASGIFSDPVKEGVNDFNQSETVEQLLTIGYPIGYGDHYAKTLRDRPDRRRMNHP
jgi:phosphatidylethanolamine-binding protein (PEBP) family uncharacterized protein